VGTPHTNQFSLIKIKAYIMANLKEKKAFLNANGVAFNATDNLETIDQLLIDNELQDAIETPVVTDAVAEVLNLVALDEEIARIRYVGKRPWKKTENNLYQKNYQISHYHVFILGNPNGADIPFWSYDEKFVDAFNSFDLAKVTFQYSGTSQKGVKNIEVQSFLTDEQLIKIEARQDRAQLRTERKEDRAFTTKQRELFIKNDNTVLRTAGEMDAIINASSAGQ
jgi:hypothetical protein